jgi:hypothetical protein
LKLSLLTEFNFMPQLDAKQAAKYGVQDISHQFPKLPKGKSGNLETPLANPAHKRLMGQPENPHGTRADKLGREPSIAGSFRKTSETPVNVRSSANAPTRPTMTSMGQPHERASSLNARGGVTSRSGDDAEFHSNDNKDGGGRVEAYGERHRSTTSPQLRNMNKPTGRPN